MNEEQLKKCNTTAFAYMGDAVYEQTVRESLLRREAERGGGFNVNDLNRRATSYVKASAQAHVVKIIFDELTEEEQKLVKRARNRKSATKARSADPVTYKWATAFEALVGYLHLAGESERLAWVMERAMEITDCQEPGHEKPAAESQP